MQTFTVNFIALINLKCCIYHTLLQIETGAVIGGIIGGALGGIVGQYSTVLQAKAVAGTAFGVLVGGAIGAGIVSYFSKKVGI